MISFPHRFHGRNSLNDVFHKGKTVRGKELSLRFVPTHRATSRVAVVISKKVAKSAVVRNRIRRRIYEIVRPRLTDFRGAYDISFGVFDSVLATQKAADVERSVLELLKSADILSSDENTKK